MYQVTPETWNEVAASGALVHPTWARIMPLPEPAMMAALDELADVWERTYPARSVRAALLVAPLLAEHAAISAYLQGHEMAWALRPAMPEVLSISEAVLIAQAEFMLEPSDCDALERLLASHLDQGHSSADADDGADSVRDSDAERIQRAFSFPLGPEGIRAMLALEEIFGRNPAANPNPCPDAER